MYNQADQTVMVQVDRQGDTEFSVSDNLLGKQARDTELATESDNLLAKQ